MSYSLVFWKSAERPVDEVISALLEDEDVSGVDPSPDVLAFRAELLENWPHLAYQVCPERPVLLPGDVNADPSNYFVAIEMHDDPEDEIAALAARHGLLGYSDIDNEPLRLIQQPSDDGREAVRVDEDWAADSPPRPQTMGSGPNAKSVLSQALQPWCTALGWARKGKSAVWGIPDTSQTFEVISSGPTLFSTGWFCLEVNGAGQVNRRVDWRHLPPGLTDKVLRANRRILEDLPPLPPSLEADLREAMQWARTPERARDPQTPYVNFQFYTEAQLLWWSRLLGPELAAIAATMA